MWKCNCRFIFGVVTILAVFIGIACSYMNMTPSHFFFMLPIHIFGIYGRMISQDNNCHSFIDATVIISCKMYGFEHFMNLVRHDKNKIYLDKDDATIKQRVLTTRGLEKFGQPFMTEKFDTVFHLHDQFEHIALYWTFPATTNDFTFLKQTTNISTSASNNNNNNIQLIKQIGNKLNKKKLIVHFHGGGFAFGTEKTALNFMALMTELTGIPSLGVNYRLTPEFFYPSQVNDGLLILLYYLNNEVYYNIDLKNIILSGDSAGATMSIQMSQRMLNAPHTLTLEHILPENRINTNIDYINNMNIDSVSEKKYQKGSNMKVGGIVSLSLGGNSKNKSSVTGSWKMNGDFDVLLSRSSSFIFGHLLYNLSVYETLIGCCDIHEKHEHLPNLIEDIGLYNCDFSKSKLVNVSTKHNIYKDGILFDNVSGFPPILLVASEFEVAFDETMLFYQHCVDHGVDATLFVDKNNGIHVLPTFTFLPEARDSAARISQWIVGLINIDDV